MEPRELPICLMHVGADGEVLAELDSVPGDGTHAAGCVIRRCNGDHAMADGGGLSEFYDGTLDPGTTVIALSCIGTAHRRAIPAFGFPEPDLWRPNVV